MKLKELLETIGLVTELEREIERVTSDITKCEEHTLFVAIVGTHFDSHRHLLLAEEKGAITLSNLGRGGMFEVADTRAILGTLLLTLANTPQQFLKIIGITGTSGKSSVGYIIYKGLMDGGKRVCFCSTDGIFLHENKLPTSNTTPSIEILSSLLEECNKLNIEYVVMEVSSHALAQYRVQGLVFDVLIYTNLGHDHLDYHGSFMEYKDMKERGLWYVKSNGLVILSKDKYIQSLRSLIKGRYIIVGEGDYAYQYTWNKHGCEVSFKGKNYQFEMHGDYEISNYLQACCALMYFMEEEWVLDWMQQPYFLPGRMQCVYRGHFEVYVDYAHTVEAFEAVGRNVHRSKYEKWLVFGLGGDRDKSKRALIGQLVESFFDVIILTSDNPRSENPYLICLDIASLMNQKPLIILERYEAIKYAITNVAEHGIIIIAGKGDEESQNISGVLTPFHDYDEIQKDISKERFITWNLINMH